MSFIIKAYIYYIYRFLWKRLYIGLMSFFVYAKVPEVKKIMNPLKMIKNMSKKGMSLQDAPGLIIVIVVAAITGAVGLLVLAGVNDSITDATATAAINNATEGVSNFFELFGVLGTVFIAIVLLGAVFMLGVMGYQKYVNR